MKKSFYLFGLFLLRFCNAEAQNITWSEDIACIIYTHCSPCHNSYNNPEVQFMNYDDVFNLRLTVELYVNTGKMPPGLTNNHYNKFVGDKALTQQQIELIKVWARDMALEGDTTMAPKAPVYTKPASTLANPDVSFQSGYVLPDTIEGHLRRCFIVPQPGNLGKYIQAIEVVPADPYIVHSVFIYSDTSAIPIFLDISDNENGYSSFFGTGSTTSKPLYGWTLGSGPFHMPGNLRLKLDSNAYFIVQIQYAEEGAKHIDSTRIQLSFDTSLNARQAVTSALLNQDDNLINGPFEIPVDSAIIFHETYNVVDDLSILSIAPNAHYFCDNMKVYALLPNKDTIRLLKIDDWDAGWSEGSYFYQKPIHLPPGTVIHAFSLYSNVNSNRHDPDDSIETIHAGVDEDGEEMVFNFTFLPYVTGDEQIVFDTAQHRPHYLGCKPVHNLSIKEDINMTEFRLFPNPANRNITIQPSVLNSSLSIVIYNSIGQICMDETVSEQQEIILDVSELKPGIYFIQINSANLSEVKRVVIDN